MKGKRKLKRLGRQQTARSVQSGGSSELPRIDLKCGQPNQASAVVNVIWSVPESLAQTLQDAGVQHSFVVIQSQKETRDGIWYDNSLDVVPLETGFLRLEFSSAGRYRVDAVVVSRQDGVAEESLTKKQAYTWFYRQFWPTFNRIIDEHYYSHPEDCVYRAKAEQVEISVDADLFAPEPPAWVVAVAKLYTDKADEPNDQCQLRKWFLLGLCLLPFTIVIGGIICVYRFVTATLLLLSGRRVDYPNAIFHPFAMRTHQMYYGGYWNDEKSFWWLTDSKGNDRHGLIVALGAVPVYYALAMISAVISVFSSPDGSGFFGIWHVKFAWLISGYLALLIISVLFGLVIRWLAKRRQFYKPNGASDEVKRLEAVRKEESRRQKIDAFYNKRIRPLTRPLNDSETVTMIALPSSHRSFRLWFGDLKAQVCKPYQKK